MEEGNDFRKWDELIPDALGLIFKNLVLSEVLTVVPRVCKAWGRVVAGPYCWQEIDIEEWSRNRKPEVVERMVRLLISRSSGSLRKLCVCGLTSEDIIMLIANNAGSLQALCIPRSGIKDSIIERAAPMLSNVTSLDLTSCTEIGARALEAIGKHCKSLTSLRRVMHPLEVDNKVSQDDEALAIAATMPKLKHLEIAYLLVDTSSVVKILENCKDLELLDVRGCWNVNLDDDLRRRFARVEVVGPIIMDCYDGWDNFSDDSSSSGYLAWDLAAEEVEDDYDEILDDFWEDEHPIEDVELWFYNDFNDVDAAYDWPQSP